MKWRLCVNGKEFLNRSIFGKDFKQGVEKNGDRALWLEIRFLLRGLEVFIYGVWKFLDIHEEVYSGIGYSIITYLLGCKVIFSSVSSFFSPL